MSEKAITRPSGQGGTNRRPANPPAGRRSAATVAALRQTAEPVENYLSPGWMLLFATFTTIALIFFLFTPYTHQLDEIKNVLLMSIPPVLLAWAVWKTDFSVMSWRTHAPTIMLGLYTLVMVISYLINPYKPVAERVVWFQVGTSTFTVIFAWFLNSEAKLRKTMMFFVLLALASTILGLVLVAGQGFTDLIYQGMKNSAYWRDPGRSPWVTLFYTLKENKEMYSSVLNSDFYAAFLVMTIPIPLSMFFVETHLLHKSIALGTFLLMGVCLFLTNSNDSYMSMVLLAIVYVVLGVLYVKGWGLSRRFIITFLIGTVILVGTVIILMLPTLARTWDFKAEAISGRNILWGGGFWPWLYFDDRTKSAIDWSSFFFGTGPGGYRFYFPVFRHPTFFDNQINNVTTFGHNIYLDVLMETGLLGLVTFLGFWFLVLWDGFQQIRRSENRVLQFYQLALVSGLTGIMVQNYFSPNNRWAVCGVIFWALFGVSMGIYHLSQPLQQPGTRPSKDGGLPWPAIAKGAVALLALLFIVRSPIQAMNYWKAAVANGLGLRNLDYADQTKGTNYEEQFLQLAAGNFEQAIRQNPTFVTSYYKLAHVYNKLGQLSEDTEKRLELTDKATQTYEALQAMNPNYSEIHQNLAIMYEAASHRLEGEEQIKMLEKAFAEAIEGAEQSWKPSMLWLTGTIGEELAAYYLAAGQDEKATEVYEKIKSHYRTILDYEPKLDREKADRQEFYPRAQAKLVRLAQLTGKPEEAEPILKSMYLENPDQPEYLDRILTYYDRYGKPEQKVAFLESAVHDDPLNVELRRKLAESYLAANNPDAHQKELRRIEVLAPGDQAVLRNLYAGYKSAGNETKAAEYRKKLEAAGVNPDAPTTAPAAAPVTDPVTSAPAAPQAPAAAATSTPTAAVQNPVSVASPATTSTDGGTTKP